MVRGCSCGWLRPRPPIPARTAKSAEPARRVPYGPLTSGWCRDPHLITEVTAPGLRNGFPAPASPARSCPSQARHPVPGWRKASIWQAGPAVLTEGSKPWPWSAVACHRPIRLEGRTRILSGPSPDLSLARTLIPSARRDDLLIRSSMCGHPDPFRTVRDLGRVPARCSWPSGIPEGRSIQWLPAWLPVAEDLAARFACRGPSAFQAGHIPQLARIARVLCAVAGRGRLPLAAAVAVRVAVSHARMNGCPVVTRVCAWCGRPIPVRRRTM